MNKTIHILQLKKTKNYSIRIFSLILLLFTFNNIVAQQASAFAKKKNYLIGDWVPIDITVSAEKDTRIFFPDFNKNVL